MLSGSINGMNSKQARQHNDAFPFTVAPCDNTRSFPMRSFPTIELARAYAAAQGARPFIIALPSGALAQ